MSNILKSVIQDLINDRPEQASVSLHEYIVGKTQELTGLKEAESTPFTLKELYDALDDCDDSYSDDNDIVFDSSSIKGQKIRIRVEDRRGDNTDAHNFVVYIDGAKVKFDGPEGGEVSFKIGDSVDDVAKEVYDSIIDACPEEEEEDDED